MKICIIGRGNVGTNICLALQRSGIEPCMVSAHTLEELPTNYDLYLYTVADHALQEVLSRVSVSPRALHIITSGTMSLSVFGDDKPHRGILYPFMTFSKAKPIEDFRVVPLFIDAPDIDDMAALYTFALMLSPHVYEATQADREKLHVAGVLVNNFPNALYALAEQMLVGTSIPFRALLPLIDETAAKVHTLSPREAQTGPAHRNDKAVMDHHRSLLPPEYRSLYEDLSRLIQTLNS